MAFKVEKSWTKLVNQVQDYTDDGLKDEDDYMP